MAHLWLHLAAGLALVAFLGATQTNGEGDLHSIKDVESFEKLVVRRDFLPRVHYLLLLPVKCFGKWHFMRLPSSQFEMFCSLLLSAAVSKRAGCCGIETGCPHNFCLVFWPAKLPLSCASDLLLCFFYDCVSLTVAGTSLFQIHSVLYFIPAAGRSYS